MTSESRDSQQRSASFIETLKAVGASFFGVRGGRAHLQDMSRLNPVHVIIVGILLALAFVLSLVWIVKSIVG